MKKLTISDKCEACGLCLGISSAIQETSDGKANAVDGGIITDEKELTKLAKITKNCPAKAISIEEYSNVATKGKAGIADLLRLMENKLQYKLPNKETYKFVNAEIPIPYSPKDYCYDYKSDSKAMSEGLNEFNRIMYSQRQALIQQIIIKYKNEVLVPYLRYENKKGNFFHEAMQNAATKLKEYVLELEEKLGYKLQLPQDFFSFRSHEDRTWKDISLNIERWTIDQGWATRIANELDELSEYKSWIDTDDTTISVQKSNFWGGDSYEEQERYCFKTQGVCKELAKDINFNCQLSLPDCAEEVIPSNLERFYSSLNKEWREKVEFIKRVCK